MEDCFIRRWGERDTGITGVGDVQMVSQPDGNPHGYSLSGVEGPQRVTLTVGEPTGETRWFVAVVTATRFQPYRFPVEQSPFFF